MPLRANIHTQARTLNSAFVRGETDLTRRPFAEISFGDFIEVKLRFTDGQQWEDWSGDAAYKPAIAVGDCGKPDSGTWTLEGGGSALQLTQITLDHNVAADTLKAEIVANSNAGESDLLVTSPGPGIYRIEFTGALGNTEIDPLEAGAFGLTPRSVATVFENREGGGGDNAVMAITLTTTPLAYSDDFEPNGDGWTGTVVFDEYALLEALEKAGGHILSTDISVIVTRPDGGRRVFARQSIAINCSVFVPALLAGPSLPNLATLSEVTSLLTGGSVSALFASVAAQDPGLHTLDEAEAEVDDAGHLTVPVPGRGNVLLLRRQADPTGGSTISTVSGLVPGALYWLVHDDGDSTAFTLSGSGDLASDDTAVRQGHPVQIRAITETTAEPVVRRDPDFSSHLDATSAGVHNSTVSATANRLVHRDGSGRAKVASPSASSDIATKGYVDARGRSTFSYGGDVDSDGEHFLEPNGTRATPTSASEVGHPFAAHDIRTISVRSEGTVSNSMTLKIYVNGSLQHTENNVSIGVTEEFSVNISVGTFQRVAVSVERNGAENPGPTIVNLNCRS